MDATEFQNLAVNLMRDNYLHDWKFAWGRGKRLGGLCTYRTKTLSFSREFVRLNDETFLRNLITHEIAHALVGHAAGHGPVWQQTHRSMGGDGKRCIDTETQPNVVHPDARYTGVCASGKHTNFRAHRRLRNMHLRYCTTCVKAGSKPGESRITWTDTVTGQPVFSAPTPEPRRLVDVNTLTHIVNVNTGERTAVRRTPKPEPVWAAGSSNWDEMFNA